MIGYGNGTPCVCGEKNTWHKKCYQNQADEITQLRARVAELEKLRPALENYKILAQDVDSPYHYKDAMKALAIAIASVKGQP